MKPSQTWETMRTNPTSAASVSLPSGCKVIAAYPKTGSDTISFVLDQKNAELYATMILALAKDKQGKPGDKFIFTIHKKTKRVTVLRRE
jgi:hypothetical protein